MNLFLLLETFVGVFAAIALVLAIVLQKHMSASASLQKANEQLELKVEEYTAALNQANEALERSEARLKEQTTQLEQVLQELEKYQAPPPPTTFLTRSPWEQLVAGLGCEIHNPITSIYSNVHHAKEYFQELINLLNLYQQHYPPIPAIQAEVEAMELDFIIEDLPKLLDSFELGADRIRQIFRSLRNVWRMDRADIKSVEIHQGIDNTLLLLHDRLKDSADRSGIQVIKEYGELPPVECNAAQLNQVFMHILTNAIDALEPQPAPRIITIRTEVSSELEEQLETQKSQSVVIRIADNGPGMIEDVKKWIFYPFFTTKPREKATGLGLFISDQIVVVKHDGKLKCVSTPGQGTEFLIEIPIRQPNREMIYS